MQAFRLRRHFDRDRARYDQGDDALGYLAPLGDGGGAAQVREAAVGAGTNKDPVDSGARDGCLGFQIHVFKRVDGALLLLGLGETLRVWNTPGHGHGLAGRGAPGDLRDDLAGIDIDLAVEYGAFIADHGAPTDQRLLPGLSLWRQGFVPQIFKGGIVSGHHSHAGAEFDRQITDRQAPFHTHVGNGAARVFHRMAGAGGDTQLADDMQDYVLGLDTRPQFTVNGDAHGLRAALADCLGGHHVHQLGRANAKSHGTHGAVGGGMAVAADQQAAGQGISGFRPDHMHDALIGMFQAVMDDARGIRHVPQAAAKCLAVLAGGQGAAGHG